jgi:8-amino-7-oxononanoate synthase
LALVNIEYVAQHSQKYYAKIKKRHKIVKESLGIEMHSLILPIIMPSNTKTMEMQHLLMKENFLIGAIRQPTVAQPILRIIPRLGSRKKHLLTLCQKLRES